MNTYMLLFIGGNIPENKWEQSVDDRLKWMQTLRDQDKFVDGSPLAPHRKVLVNQRDAQNYSHNQDSINGFVIVSVQDIEDVIEIAKHSPQAQLEYGSARVEIRQLQPLVGDR